MIKLLNKIINKVSKEKWSVNSDGEVIAKDNGAGPDDCGQKFIACTGTQQHARYIAALNPSFLSELAEHLNALENRAEMAEAEVQRLNATAQPVSEQHGKIADALESLLWPNMASGNKGIINAAIQALRAKSAQPVSDGWVSVPRSLTAENGAKAALFGEFSVQQNITCHECFGEGCDDCNGQGNWTNSVPVDWTTIKEIWAKGVEHFLAAAPGGQDV